MIKRIIRISLITVLAFADRETAFAQNSLDGLWYLQEVQIPINEEFAEGVSYDKNDCIIMTNNATKTNSGGNNWSNNILPTENEIDAFFQEWKNMSHEEFENDSAEKPVHIQPVLSREDDGEVIANEIAFIHTPQENCVYIKYQIYNDSVLVLSEREGLYDVYLIKHHSENELVLATDRTFHGYMVLIYGKTKQSIKHTKHDIKTARTNHNPIVNRISPNELKENNTPAAVAYNFVNAILESNTERMLSYMDNKVANEYERARIANGYANYAPFFSKSGDKLNILGWRPYLEKNCEMAVLFVQDEWFDEYGREIKKVYIDCVPKAEVGQLGFQNITTYGGTNVKVLVAKEKRGWVVLGFK